MYAGRGRPPNCRGPTQDPRTQPPQSHHQAPTRRQAATDQPTPSSFVTQTSPQNTQLIDITATRRMERSIPPRGRQTNAVASSSRENSAPAPRASVNHSRSRLRQSTLSFRPTQRPTDAAEESSAAPSHADGWEPPPNVELTPAPQPTPQPSPSFYD
jgi:hypothetical protein